LSNSAEFPLAKTFSMTVLASARASSDAFFSVLARIVDAYKQLVVRKGDELAIIVNDQTLF
jgi:hypothetical protein